MTDIVSMLLGDSSYSYLAPIITLVVACTACNVAIELIPFLLRSLFGGRDK